MPLSPWRCRQRGRARSPSTTRAGRRARRASTQSAERVSRGRGRWGHGRRRGAGRSSSRAGRQARFAHRSRSRKTMRPFARFAAITARRGFARRLAPLVAAVAVAVPLVGCGATNSARSPANVTVTVTQTVGGTVKRSPTVTTQPKKPPPIAEPASLKTFTGNYFSVDYSGS